MDPVTTDTICRAFGSAQEAVQRGVSVGRATFTNTTWKIWTEFTTNMLAVDPLLTPFQDKVPILQIFGQLVREGTLAAKQGKVGARHSEDYLRTISSTFLHLGSKDPRLTDQGKMDFRITRMITAWKKEDPPPHRVKPLPIQVIKHISFEAIHTPDPLTQAVADMIIIAFFFLLRPGEYTDDQKPDATPFRICDVQLFIGEQRLDVKTSTTAELTAARFASLTFTNQKNGVRGEVIGLALSGDLFICPVRAIIRRILHWRTSSSLDDTAPLARVYLQTNAGDSAAGGIADTTTHVTSKRITDVIRVAVFAIGPSLGFLPSDVSARSLRAAGANALLLANIDTDIIRLIGRWRSDEMLRYLHVQAAPLMANYAARMLQAGQYTIIPNQMVPSF